MTRSRLPLRAISVFEAVARLGSFRAAAGEMHLTPSAVSHQVRALEQELGLALFVRDGGGVRLTPVAAGYAERLHGLLDRLHAATDEVAAHGSRHVLTGSVRILTPPSLATHWLMPRMPAFLEAHPGLDIRVIAIRRADSKVDDFDITIAYGEQARGKGRVRPLLEETYRPFCAPSLLAGARSMTARDLLDQPLIRSRDNDVSWEGWFAQRGLAFISGAANQVQLDPSYVAIEAAVKGVGFVLESSTLTAEHVQHGRLVAPLAEPGQPAISYWLLPLRPGAAAPARLTYRWLLAQGNTAGR